MFQGSAYQQAHKQVNPQAFSRCSCFLPSFLLHCSRSFLRPPFFAGKISAYFMELGAFCSGLLFLLRKAGSCLFLAVLYGCLAKLSWTYCFLESPCGFWSYFAGPLAVLQVGSILAPAALFAGHFFWLKKSIFCIKMQYPLEPYFTGSLAMYTSDGQSGAGRKTQPEKTSCSGKPGRSTERMELVSHKCFLKKEFEHYEAIYA